MFGLSSWLPQRSDEGYDLLNPLLPFNNKCSTKCKTNYIIPDSSHGDCLAPISKMCLVLVLHGMNNSEPYKKALSKSGPL